MTTDAQPTTTEIHARLEEMRRILGRDAYLVLSMSVAIWISEPKPVWSLHIHPHGLGSGGHHTIDGEIEHCLTTGLAWVHETTTERRRTRVRSMALRIVELTRDRGECRADMLRIWYNENEIRDLAADATAEADVLAAGGPFRVLPAQTAGNAPVDGALEKDPTW